MRDRHDEPAKAAPGQAVERDHPDLYTTSMSKRVRTGKIFLDYLRDDKTTTAVAPWSPRARPGASIAVPLEWSTLRKGLAPSRFAISSIKPLLRKPDPWKDIERSAGSLEEARRKLRS